MKITGPSTPARPPVGDDERVDASAAAASVETSLDGASTYASAPSGRTGGDLTTGGSLDVLGRSPSGTVGDGQREASLGLSTGGVFGSATVRADRGADERSSVNAYWEPGWLSGGGGHEWATTDGGRRGVGASLSLWDGGVGASVSYDVTRADGRGIDVGVFVGLDADRSITDLGEQDDGRHRIEVTRTKGGSLFASPGVFGDVLGLGLRMGGGKSREVVYRTNVALDDARRLLTEKQGVVGWARDLGRGAGLADDPVVIPDLRAPDTLAVGDEVVTKTSGEVLGGLFIGGLPFRVGAQGKMSGDFELGVKRTDEHHVSVVITPRAVRGLTVQVGIPIALDGDVSRTSAAAMRQAFTFDLREPQARAAYERVLDGELPGGVTAEAHLPAGNDALDLRAALAAEVLPAGTERSYAEVVEARRTRAGVGLAVGLWHRSTSFVGLGQEHMGERHKSEVVTRDGVWTRDVRGTERRRHLLLSGQESRGVFAAVKRSTTFDDDGNARHTFGGLTLELRLADTRVRGLELNSDVISVINEALDLNLEPFTRGGRKKSRQVTVARTLTGDDLARLGQAGGDALGELRARLATCDDDIARAAAVQAAVASGGLRTLTAVCAALGGGRDAYDVATTASVYDEPVARADELALRYAAPLSADLDKSALTKRFTDVDKALVDVRASLLDARADPLLDDRAAEKVIPKLENADAQLATMLSTSHLSDEERATLCARLESGWTTGQQRRIIARLSA